MNNNIVNLVVVIVAGVLVFLGARFAAERQFKESCRQTCITDAGHDSPSSAFIVRRNLEGKLQCECVVVSED